MSCMLLGPVESHARCHGDSLGKRSDNLLIGVTSCYLQEIT